MSELTLLCLLGFFFSLKGEGAVLHNHQTRTCSLNYHVLTEVTSVNPHGISYTRDSLESNPCSALAGNKGWYCCHVASRDPRRCVTSYICVSVNPQPQYPLNRMCTACSTTIGMNQLLLASQAPSGCSRKWWTTGLVSLYHYLLTCL